ncbi:hypothetical protein ACFPYI_15220 [Halomarina salina]|uniref:Uncharacterized protein n=1 Tax=Halomarina salina TaxID=1872699 RepID=A0ABD5RPV5_9EURY|nr:hypothetical protein [Halomarina salina]
MAESPSLRTLFAGTQMTLVALVLFLGGTSGYPLGTGFLLPIAGPVAVGVTR